MITDEQKREFSDMPYWDDYLCFPQPFWHNISPGRTTLDEAIAIIQADPGLELFHADVPRGRIYMWNRISNPQAGGMISSEYRDKDDKRPAMVLGLYVHEAHEHELRLKDAITIYGNPLDLHYVFGEGPKADGVYVHFPGNVVAVVYDLLKPMARDLFPDSSIVQVYYSDSISEMPDKLPWTGYSRPPTTL